MKQIKKLVLDSIDIDYIVSEYDLELINVTQDSSPIQLAKTVFELEKDHDIKRLGYKKALQDWLQGMTNCVNVPYMDCEVLDFGYESCILKRGLDQHNKEMKEESFLNDYWSMLAGAMIELIEDEQA